MTTEKLGNVAAPVAAATASHRPVSSTGAGLVTTKNPDSEGRSNLQVIARPAATPQRTAPVEVTVKPPLRYRIRRVPAIDGLRGLAVLVVVIYHFFGPLAPGGFMGVDMFFVLSGFLITSLLIRERAVMGRVDLKKFWLRRARRILPAATSVLVLGTAAAGLVGGDAAVGLKSQFFGTLFFANNWVQIAGSQSYFAETGVQIFAHYWSLAVEEQFYVIFPLLFIVLSRFGSGVLKLVVALLGAASFLWMLLLYDPQADPTRVYYGTDSHSFGLLLGVLLACITTTTVADPQVDSWPLQWIRDRKTVVSTVGLVTLIALLVMVVVVPDTSVFTYRGGLLLASFLTMILLATLLCETGPAYWAMNLKPMRWLGERSFSIYLWHWPVIVIIKQLVFNHELGWNDWVIGFIALAISLPLSHYSYEWIETPIRRKGYLKVWKLAKAWSKTAFITTAAFSTLIAGAAVASSVNETALQQELTVLAEQNSETTKEITAIPAASTEDVTQEMYGPQLIPTGDRITAVGDSVMLASLPALEEHFPGIYVDGAVSRTLLAAPEILTGLDQAGKLDPFVVLGFGTNDEFSLTQLEEVMSIVGDKRVVVLVMPYGDRSWIPGSQANITKAQDLYPNLYVADWCQRAQADKTLLYSDLIHPTEAGANAYAESIEYALNQWANHRKRPVATCGV